MTAQRLSDKSIFLEAIDISCPAARAAYIDQACGNDQMLLAQVHSLLNAHDKPQNLLDTAKVPSLTLDSQLVSEGPGTIIGPYKLLKQIGAGGMGTVYLAEQTRPVRRRVALKIINPGMDSRQVIARFETERQAVALMDHPNIAKVLDAGTLENTKPYFVMELVIGETINAYCDANRLSIQERLELFIPVCHAVQHAHQKGIIHRDLKPSNVLVGRYDDRPVPKVIDFGLAKAAGLNLVERTTLTQQGQLVGTLEYMSPEQASLSALDVDTRSDIYSLGVLLYELLVGSTPLTGVRLCEAGLDEVLSMIREEETPAPSARLAGTAELADIAARRAMAPAALVRHVKGDLDWIALKALDKDRKRRYTTPGELAEDIERFLRHEAVLARPPSASYRLRKFVRRNRATVLALSAVAAGLIIGAVLATWQAIVATTAHEDAVTAAAAAKTAQELSETREAQTRAVLDFLENQVLAAARPEGQAGGLGRDVTVREAMQAALPIVATRFGDQPIIEAKLRMSMGESFIFLGEAALAAEQQEARTLFMKCLGLEHPDTVRCMSDLANCYFALGRHTEALTLYEQTLVLRQARLGSDHPVALRNVTNLASCLHQLGRKGEALSLRKQTLELQKSKLGPDHADTLVSMNNLAVSYTDFGYHAAALEVNEETLIRRKALLGPNHPDTLMSMSNLANSYHNHGRHDDALKLREDTLELQRAKLGPNHPGTLMSMNNLALTYTYLGRNADALALHKETLALAKAKLGDDHPETLEYMNNVAIGMGLLGRHDDAFNLHEETLALRQTKLGPDHLDTLLSMQNLANSSFALGRRALALKLREETLLPLQAKVGADHPDTLRAMTNLANSYAAMGRHAEALKLRTEVLALQKKRLGDHVETIRSMSNLAVTYSALGRRTEALELNKQAFALMKDKLGPDYPDTLYSMSNLAENHAALGEYAEALALHQEKRTLLNAKVGPDHEDALLTSASIAVCLIRLQRGAEAIPLIDSCIDRTSNNSQARLLSQFIELRLRYFEQARDADGCRGTAELWEKLKGGDAGSIYNAACYRAVAAAVLRSGVKSAQTAKQADGEADRAMAWLNMAVESGYKDIGHLRQDHDLDALRDRDDFRKLLTELDAHN